MKKFLLIIIIIISYSSFSQSENDNTYTALSKVNFYPNPAKGDYITIFTNFDITVTVYDLLGKTVLTKAITIKKNKVDISDIGQGIYLIKFSTRSHSATKKFIKQ